MFRLFLGDEVSYPVVLRLFDKPWNLRIPIHQAGFKWMESIRGFGAISFRSLQGSSTYTSAPDPRKLTAKTTLKTWWLLGWKTHLSFSVIFFWGGGLILNFLGWHLGHCVFFFIFQFLFHFCSRVLFKGRIEILGTSTLTKAMVSLQVHEFLRSPKNVFTAFFLR